MELEPLEPKDRTIGVVRVEEEVIRFETTLVITIDDRDPVVDLTATASNGWNVTVDPIRVVTNNTGRWAVDVLVVAPPSLGDSPARILILLHADARGPQFTTRNDTAEAFLLVVPDLPAVATLPVESAGSSEPAGADDGGDPPAGMAAAARAAVPDGGRPRPTPARR